MDTIPAIFAAYAHESCYPPPLEAPGPAETAATTRERLPNTIPCSSNMQGPDFG